MSFPPSKALDAIQGKIKLLLPGWKKGGLETIGAISPINNCYAKVSKFLVAGNIGITTNAFATNLNHVLSISGETHLEYQSCG